MLDFAGEVEALKLLLVEVVALTALVTEPNSAVTAIDAQILLADSVFAKASLAVEFVAVKA